MPRYAQEGPLDTQQGDLGDKGFVGVNMRLEPHNVPAGYVASAINARFRDGAVETRKGVVNVSWASKLSGSNWLPWGTVHGVTTFKDPITGIEYLIIAANGAVYYTYENSTAQTIPLASGITVSGTVEFVQAFDKLLMLRGENDTTVVMETLTEGFKEITQSSEGDGTFAIPRADRGVAMANRVFVISLTDDTQTVGEESVTLSSSDNVAYSDVLDYTRYSIDQEFRINQGENDKLIALQQFGKSTLLCFKKSNVYRLDNVYGDLSNATLTRITSRYGCIAPESIVDTGTDVLWLSKEGIASLTVTQFAEIQPGQGAIATKPRMFSEDIQPLIDRINWEYAQNSIGKLWNNRAYFAVPLDDAEVLEDNISASSLQLVSQQSFTVVQGATYRWKRGANETSLVNGTETLTGSGDFTAQGTTIAINKTVGESLDGSVRRVYKGVNNAILVYDFLNGAWSGYDEIPGTSIKDMFKYTYLGRERLFIINQNGWVQLYEEDYEDQLAVPYTDFEIISNASTDLEFNVNSGTAISANSLAADNSGTTIGTSGTLAADIGNLWSDPDQQGGYDQSLGISAWTAPNTIPVYISTGVRFYSTTGTIPSVNVTLDSNSVTRVSQVSTQPVDLTVEFRAYDSPTASGVYYQWLTVDLQSWSPKYTISLITEGVEEEDTKVTERTKSRTTWDRPFNKAAFEVDNDNGDFMDPYREDYSILLGTRGATDFALHTVTNGVRLDLHQETRELFRLNRRSRGGQPKIVNTDGRLRIVGVNVTTNLKNRQASERST